MHAIRLHTFGGPEQLVLERVPEPTPGDGQVRIDVAAAGVHVIDTAIRAGQPPGPFPLPSLPTTPGREIVGTVDAVGPDVDPAWHGRPVAAHLGAADGGYAEAALAPVSALHVLPADHDPAAVVAMLGTGRTALAILDAAPLTDDDVVVVTAAAGGIGTLLVQAARAVGATVVGLAGGAAKVALVRDGGAIGVDYTRAGWEQEVLDALAGRRPTVAFDGVGGAAGRSVLELLAPAGRLVLYGWSSGEPTALDASDLVAGSLTVTAAIGPGLTRRPGGLRPLEERALAALAAGELVPAVQTFPLAAAAAAHRAIEARSTTGKVVLVTR